MRGHPKSCHAAMTDRPRLPEREVVVGLAHASRRAHAERGIGARLILCLLLHPSEEAAFAMLEAALPFREHFIGLGLDSSERGHPPEELAPVFARHASSAGMCLHMPASKGPPSTSGMRRMF
jgi:adenosine deaminase